MIRADGIFSTIFDESGKKIAVGAEHSYKNKPLIPSGVYLCKRRFSPKFQYDIFWLTDVPGHDLIEIHRGNWPQIDSQGCILLGESVIEYDNGSVAISKSKKTFESFMKIQSGVDEFQLTIT
jgi:hypothetical protein